VSGTFECGVCWGVYDPAAGDPVWQIPPGTPFEALPEHWKCPSCDAAKEKFLIEVVEGFPEAPPVHPAPEPSRRVEGSAGLPAGSALRTPVPPVPTDLAEQLTLAYRAAMPRMAGLPITNPKLDVVCSRAVPSDGGQLAVAMTPWCLNAVYVPERPTGLKGATMTRVLPSGAYEFVVGELEGVGQVWSLSLLSPVLEFDGPQAAKLAVDAALEALITAPAPEAPIAHSRRALFGLGTPAP
jgi:[NiFe] hydrogenase assembly HybE family chaperone